MLLVHVQERSVPPLREEQPAAAGDGAVHAVTSTARRLAVADASAETT